MDLSSLNKNQRLAVETTEGPVMVMAGAGSGKTRVLTYRIAHLILDLGIIPGNILAVTFTNKAAREMKERIENLTNEDVRHMWVSTFHSFCARFLRIELDSFKGFSKNFTIIDEDDALKIIKDIMKNDNIDVKEYKPKRILGLISDEKNKEIISISDPFLKNYYPKIFDKYNEALKKDNLLDFDDLIKLTLELLKERPETLAKYRKKFSYIMVDEFQDTNIIQYELIKLLTSDTQNIFIVGDQDQSIYSFRGAKVENIDLFIKDFPLCKQILLEENYRSTNPILKIANNSYFLVGEMWQKWIQDGTYWGVFFLYVVLNSLQVAAWSSMLGLCVAAFSENRYVVAAVPFFINRIFLYLGDMIDWLSIVSPYSYQPIQFWYTGTQVDLFWLAFKNLAVMFLFTCIFIEEMKWRASHG